MANIEERAKEYAQAYNPKESAVQYAVERAYGIGATDQQKIDIKRACEWLIRNVINYIEGDYSYNYNELKKDFKQAMKE